jgi:hypothetical protein
MSWSCGPLVLDFEVETPSIFIAVYSCRVTFDISLVHVWSYN